MGLAVLDPTTRTDGLGGVAAAAGKLAFFKNGKVRVPLMASSVELERRATL